MTFVSTLTSGEISDARAGGFNVRQLVLACPNTVIFQAQINQSEFDTSYAELTFDNVSVGAYTAISEGYTIYVSDTAGDLRNPVFEGRVRSDNSGVVSTASTVNINWTSANLQDDQYIMVVKDVREWFKMPRPRTDGTDIQYKDYDHVYADGLRPLVYGLQTVYAAALNGSGNADFVLEPSGLAVNNGATISSWAWDADGGSFQSGSASTQNVTIRYTSAGHYMPRVTVTDSNGKTNWFTFHVFVGNAPMPSDLT